MRRALFVLVVVLSSFLGLSQEKYEISPEDYGNSEVEMADTFRKEGKIYVVVGVTLLILGGLFAYTVSTDRKIGRLERMLKNTDMQEPQIK